MEQDLFKPLTPRQRQYGMKLKSTKFKSRLNRTIDKISFTGGRPLTIKEVYEGFKA